MFACVFHFTEQFSPYKLTSTSYLNKIIDVFRKKIRIITFILEANIGLLFSFLYISNKILLQTKMCFLVNIIIKTRLVWKKTHENDVHVFATFYVNAWTYSYDTGMHLIYKRKLGIHISHCFFGRRWTYELLVLFLIIKVRMLYII